jgi:hypothetical protein
LELQCHLAAPDGVRVAGFDDDDELDENEEPDRIRFKEALGTIGALGREAPSHSLSVMTQLLEGRISRFGGIGCSFNSFELRADLKKILLGCTITYNESFLKVETQ